MRIFRHYDHLPDEARNSVIAVGNFDGVHLGHQAVIGEAMERARAARKPGAVMTFEPHPRSYFAPNAPPFRLTPLRIKTHCIEGLGVDLLFVIHFDVALAAMSAEDFVDRVLIGALEAVHVVVGYDFVFGHKRRGNADLLEDMAKRRGFGITAVAPVAEEGGEVYSSTRIRDLLRSGKPAAAAALLGRTWEIEGRVVPGDARGREIGYPTANVDFERSYLRPAHGVYAVRAGIDHGRGTVWHEAVANFGIRPTVAGESEVFEAHLFDYDGDLYGKHLRVALVEYLRPEKKFDGLDALRAQIAEDSRQALAVLKRTEASFRAAERPLGGDEDAAAGRTLTGS